MEGLDGLDEGGCLNTHLIVTWLGRPWSLIPTKNEGHRDGKVPGALFPSCYGRKEEGTTVFELGVNTLEQRR